MTVCGPVEGKVNRVSSYCFEFFSSSCLLEVGLQCWNARTRSSTVSWAVQLTEVPAPFPARQPGILGPHPVSLRTCPLLGQNPFNQSKNTAPCPQPNALPMSLTFSPWFFLVGSMVKWKVNDCDPGYPDFQIPLLASYVILGAILNTYVNLSFLSHKSGIIPTS